MPAVSRKRKSRARSGSKPYERLPHSSSPALSDDQDGDECLPSPILVTADKPGFPTYAQYKRIEMAYLQSLSPRKRDKALISQCMFDKIWDVLHQPDACTIGTPQFRFWVRKMFTLSTPDTEDGDNEVPVVILHENRPVAVQEQLYELFCYCHEESNHGGRDKTCAIIRQHYSWVPKELTAQFVKACPTCTFKRSGNPELIALVQGKMSSRELNEEQVEETKGSLCRPGSPETGWQFSGGPLDQSPLDQTGDVSCSLDTTNGSPSTPSPSLYLRSSKLLLRPRPPLLDSRLEDLNGIHLRQIPVGLHPLALDLASLCSHSDAKPGDLPCLAEAYRDDTMDDQYRLPALWPENISDSLPPELQRLQLSSPVCTQNVQINQIDPALLTREETNNREREGCMGELSPLPPYSPSGFSLSPNLRFPPSPVTPEEQQHHSVCEDWRPSSLRISPAPSRLRSDNLSAYLTPAFNFATDNRSMTDSQYHTLPVTLSPPLTPLTPFISASPTPAEEGEFGDELLRGY
ncbi:uncharacterized protein BJ212DRAFT_1461295 [Suillus subaureus]|uniref:Integrase zinc-binding domain-containing protein n=1 Tax=Suillus subaureus TaxID=48587 RepID=A0A9P7EBW2_9AGAM|nr:uncharacterized protein BJ212DRAFT_1461295 [Suillus subaureus]KAG1816788.1 hypothetical protein BJ212DRAFT_1461295 [Suillus subaureus]